MLVMKIEPFTRKYTATPPPPLITENLHKNVFLEINEKRVIILV